MAIEVLLEHWSGVLLVEDAEAAANEAFVQADDLVLTAQRFLPDEVAPQGVDFERAARNDLLGVVFGHCGLHFDPDPDSHVHPDHLDQNVHE